VVSLIVAFFGYHTTSFRLDASADSLVLENDKSLKYYRSIRARYGSDDYLILTYTPNGDLFSTPVLTELGNLRDDILQLELVESVVSILDVPLIKSPPVSINDLNKEVPTLESALTNKEMAREEFLSSKLYNNLIISPDGKTTALQIQFKRDQLWQELLDKRNYLQEKRLQGDLSDEENRTLELVSNRFDIHLGRLQEQTSNEIIKVRNIMDTYRGNAVLHLGGVPMITSDSMDFIRHDLIVFGFGVLCFLILILTFAFRRARWVILPMLTCFATGIVTVGFLGLVDWPVTVVSSNFVSLLLIITLSLTVHLIVRYREHHLLSPQATQYTLVADTIKAKFLPCFYTAITTMVAFGSLMFSRIRPVIDFGWMMTIGIAIAFVLVFTLFPVTLLSLKPGKPASRNDLTNKIIRFLATINKVYFNWILSIFAVLAVLAVIGMSFLTVENRFIDYFKKSTEIYQGMELIDKKLGGTTPLDVIIDPPAEYYAENGDVEEIIDEDEDDDWGEDSSGITSNSFWINSYMLADVSAIHDYLDDLSETGKVLSVITSLKILKHFDEQIMSDDFALSILYKQLPDEVTEILFNPYMTEDGNQIRFSIRVFESDLSLKRDNLLKKIQTDLKTQFNLKPEQIHLTGMLVLYNNMLQSLFESQILTIAVVFLAIMLMFIILFRNFKMATVAIIPNIFAAGLMLGLMGWLGIPLDLMTITIAAITIGIAVDDTIHYVHRFTTEFTTDNNYWAAVNRSHATIGRAMYYTSITIMLGFIILVLSKFIPTIYFGLLTSFAMLIALLANLTLLPLLIVRYKPLKPK